MNWEQLLSLKDKATQASDLIEQDDTRLGFEVDYDRIIFRRLLEVSKIKHR
jgi:dGTPase